MPRSSSNFDGGPRLGSAVVVAGGARVWVRHVLGGFECGPGLVHDPLTGFRLVLLALVASAASGAGGEVAEHALEHGGQLLEVVGGEAVEEAADGRAEEGREAGAEGDSGVGEFYAY